MKKHNTTSTIITIHAENSKGVLARILGILDRPNYYLINMTMAITDINNEISITVEAQIPRAELKNLLFRLERIIEVEKAEVHPDAILLKSGVFRILLSLADDRFWQLVQKYGVVVTVEGDYLLLQKTAHQSVLLELYNQLDQVYLHQYSESALSVINKNNVHHQDDKALTIG